ncbi:MAG: hypothetical protein ACJAZD_001932, partial [Ilumatobacter sp.]
DGPTNRCGVDPSFVACDHALLLKSLDPIGDRRWGEMDAIAELTPADSCVMTHLTEDSSINGVKT